MHIQQNCSAVSQFVESVKRYMTPVKYLSLQTCFFFFLFSFASSSIRRIVVVVFVLSIFRPCRRQKTMWLYVAFDVNCLYRHSVVRIYRCQTIRLSVTNYVTVSSCSCKINKTICTYGHQILCIWWPWNTLDWGWFGVQRSKVKIARISNVSVPVYLYRVIALYRHLLDGATICCWPRDVILIRLRCYLSTYTYLLNPPMDGRGYNGLWLHVIIIIIIMAAS